MTSESFDLSQSKCVIVLGEGLGSGIAVNVAAVLGLSVGLRVGFPLGGDAVDADGDAHLALPRIGVPLLVTPVAELPGLRRQALARRLTVVDYTEAARHPDYGAYERALAAAGADQHQYFGLALAGRRRDINSVAGNLRLYR